MSRRHYAHDPIENLLVLRSGYDSFGFGQRVLQGAKMLDEIGQAKVPRIRRGASELQFDLRVLSHGAFLSERPCSSFPARRGRTGTRIESRDAHSLLFSFFAVRFPHESDPPIAFRRPA